MASQAVNLQDATNKVVELISQQKARLVKIEEGIIAKKRTKDTLQFHFEKIKHELNDINTEIAHYEDEHKAISKRLRESTLQFEKLSWDAQKLVETLSEFEQS